MKFQKEPIDMGKTKMSDKEETKHPVSTVQQRFSDLRTTDAREIVRIQDGFSDDLGGWDEIAEGQRVILGILQIGRRPN